MSVLIPEVTYDHEQCYLLGLRKDAAVIRDPSLSWSQSHYNMLDKNIYLSEDADEYTEAHEKGHQQAGHRMWPRVLSAAGIVAAPMLSGAAMLQPHPETRQLLHNLSAASNLAHIPTLTQELDASYRGAQMLPDKTFAQRAQTFKGLPQYAAVPAGMLLLNEISRALGQIINKQADYAKGIPDKRYYRPIEQLQPGQMLDYLIQQHNAYRAGPHKDVRFGDEKGLYSWATRKPLPAPGSRTALFEQPTHSHKYLGWEGEIPRGQYGGGTVKVEDQGKVLVTSVKPDMIHFTVAHKRFPERFVLMKPKGWKEPKSWLLINKTPTAGLPYEKVRYQKIPATDVEKYIDKMQRGDTFEAKIDGASSLIKLLKDGVELTSYRQSKETGRPILHTERVLDGLPKMEIPNELVGTILKGELYGVRNGGRPGVARLGSSGATDGAGDLEAISDYRRGEGAHERVIPPQELGGLLNSSLSKTLEDKRSRGIKLRNMVYDIQQLGKKPIDWHTTPRMDRRKLIEQVLGYLPSDVFHISPAAETQEDARKLWMDVQQGTHPLTHEGVVMWPQGGPPLKSKLTEDTDVHITGTFPGEGKYQGTGIGGFTYGLEPGGPTVGRVGTGITDALRAEGFANPNQYTGRVARIRAQEQLPSGAYRAPAFLAFHEDYPGAKVASVLVPEPHLTLEQVTELGIWTEDE